MNKSIKGGGKRGWIWEKAASYSSSFVCRSMGVALSLVLCLGVSLQHKERAGILALKHISRILGHCNNPALLVSHFSLKEMPSQQTSQKDGAVLLRCPRILLTCFRARMFGRESVVRDLLTKADSPPQFRCWNEFIAREGRLKKAARMGWGISWKIKEEHSFYGAWSERHETWQKGWFH